MQVHTRAGGVWVWLVTHLLAILGSSSKITLGLVASRVVTTILLILLFLLCATAEHGEDGRRGDGLGLLETGS